MATQTKPKIEIYDASTNEAIVREMTDQEYEKHLEVKAEAEKIYESRRK